MPPKRMRVGILISGRGSNMAALIDAARASDYPAKIVCVISNKASAGGLDIAAQAGIPTKVIAHRDFPDREAFDMAVDAELRRHGVELLCLAGFMRLLTPAFIGRWPDRILNIHPSLLPAFRGLDTHKRAIEAGCKITGCTVHVVRPELDEGPIIAQAAVPIFDDDSEDSLAARILVEEHKLYPAAVRLIAEGRAIIDGMRVRTPDAKQPDDVLRHPAV